MRINLYTRHKTSHILLVITYVKITKENNNNNTNTNRLPITALPEFSQQRIFC